MAKIDTIPDFSIGAEDGRKSYIHVLDAWVGKLDLMSPFTTPLQELEAHLASKPHQIEVLYDAHVAALETTIEFRRLMEAVDSPR